MKKILQNLRENFNIASGFIFLLALIFQIIIPWRTNAQTNSIQTNIPALTNVYADYFYICCRLSYRHIDFSTDPVVSGRPSSSMLDAGDQGKPAFYFSVKVTPHDILYYPAIKCSRTNFC
jgi:hypothetical protein